MKTSKVRIRSSQSRVAGDACGSTIRFTDQETGIEYIAQLTLTGDGHLRVEHGPYNGRKTETKVGPIHQEQGAM